MSLALRENFPALALVPDIDIRAITEANFGNVIARESKASIQQRNLVALTMR